MIKYVLLLSLFLCQVSPGQQDYQRMGKNFEVQEWGDLTGGRNTSGPYYFILNDKRKNKTFIYIQNKDGSGIFQPY